jgi:hypothetical protein
MGCGGKLTLITECAHMTRATALTCRRLEHFAGRSTHRHVEKILLHPALDAWKRESEVKLRRGVSYKGHG